MKEIIEVVEHPYLVCKICKLKNQSIINLNNILYELCHTYYVNILKDYKSISIGDICQILEPYRADRIMEDEISTDYRIK